MFNPCKLSRSARRFGILVELGIAETLEPRELLTALPLLEAMSQPGIGHPALLSTEQPGMALSDIHRSTGVHFAHTEYGLTGAGQTVVIIDSGVAYDHVSLGGGLGSEYRVVGGWDFTEEQDADPYDDGPAGFHGTHVAGIVASSDVTHRGVAPEVDVVALRVFNDQGRGKLSWLESSLDWVIDHVNSFENPITTVNLSIGTDWNSLTLPEYATLEDELRSLHKLGVFVAVAAGNRFDKDEVGLSYPAVSPHVTAVASQASRGTLTDFTQRHTSVLVAPGENIVSTVPDYLEDFNGLADDYYAASGTSMAAPYVAGASILLREAMQRAERTSITPDAIRRVLFETADEIYDQTTGKTYHRINVATAVESILQEQIVVQNGASLIVKGSDLPDEIRVDPLGMIHVNGQSFRFSPREIKRIKIEGSGGKDLLVVQSRFDAARIHFSPGSVEIDANNLLVADGFERIDVLVNGDAASATFVGGDARDELFVKQTHSWMEGPGYLNYVRGAKSINGWANTPDDVVVLHDTSGNDALVSRPESTSLRADTMSAHVYGFSQVVVQATGGGFDHASIVGTVEHDSITATPTYTSLKNDSFFVYTKGFDHTRVFGGGGSDSAKLYDSRGDDRLLMGFGSQSLVTPISRTNLSAIGRVEAFASEGDDRVDLLGSSGSEKFTAKPTHSWMELGTSLNYARGFDAVTIHGGGGNDSAMLYDSIENDSFVLSPQSSRLTSLQFRYEVNMVARVHAISRHGKDSVQFFDSASTDELFATTKGTWMKGAKYMTIAESFEQIVAESQSGSDRLIVDSALTVTDDNIDGLLIEDDAFEVLVKGFRL